MVNGMHHRHPALTANMAATVDIISGGRLELGMGAGWNEMESNAYGIELGTLKQRFDRFDEGIEIIRSLLDNTVTNFTGEYFTVTDAWCEPKPVQAKLPLVIGGQGEDTNAQNRRPLGRPVGHDVPRRRRRDWSELDVVLRDHCDDVGRDQGEITRSVHLALRRGRRPGRVRPIMRPDSSTPASTSWSGRCADRSGPTAWPRSPTRCAERQPPSRFTSVTVYLWSRGSSPAGRALGPATSAMWSEAK